MSETQPEEIMSIQDINYLDETLTQISEIYVQIDEVRTRLENERQLIGNLPSNSKTAIKEEVATLKTNVKTLIELNIEKCTYLLRNFPSDFFDCALRGSKRIYTLDENEIDAFSKRYKVLVDMFESHSELLDLVIDAINANVITSQSRNNRK
jgi:hypothetical protein